MLKKILKRIVYREKSNSEEYIRFLRKKGIEIGENCTIYVPTKTFIDTQYPYMIKIGDHVKITLGVIILTHDFSWTVLKNFKDAAYEGSVLGGSGPVIIGNNVFIGMNSIICRNVKIGDNVIIGAGSVVVKNCDSNSVYAGNPAKKIMSVDDYYKKRYAKQFEEAYTVFHYYHKKYKEIPPKAIFNEYFMLFENVESLKNNHVFVDMIELGEGGKYSYCYLKTNQPKFHNYEEFIEACKKREQEAL